MLQLFIDVGNVFKLGLFSSSVSCVVMVYLESVNVESCSAGVFLSLC